ALEVVGAGVAADEVVSGAAFDLVVTAAAADDVVAALALDLVVAAAPVDHVVARGAFDVVVAGRPHDGGDLAGARHHCGRLGNGCGGGEQDDEESCGESPPQGVSR